jgi:hypothetical protein
MVCTLLRRDPAAAAAAAVALFRLQQHLLHVVEDVRKLVTVIETNVSPYRQPITAMMLILASKCCSTNSSACLDVCTASQ